MILIVKNESRIFKFFVTQMKTANKIDLPILKDVVVPGKDVPTTEELPPILNEIQIKALQQQIEKIVQARIEVALNKAMKGVVTDIKAYLDKVLPKLIKSAND